MRCFTRSPYPPQVLSDRSIKYKYLNPNLLFVATAAADEASAAATESVFAEIVIHIVDTVTGRILHRQSHAGAVGPVTAVMTENAVLYFYRDLDTGRCAILLGDASCLVFGKYSHDWIQDTRTHDWIQSTMIGSRAPVLLLD